MGTTTAALTVEQFMQLPEEQTLRCELIDGEIVPMGNASWRHEVVKARFNELLVAYILQNRIGLVFSDTMFALRSTEGRIPDVSLRLANRPFPSDPKGPFAGSPDLAVEIVSSESAEKLNDKISAYLATGSQTVLVAYPNQRTIWVHRPNGEAKRFSEGDYLELPELLPGFRVEVSKFFEGI